MEELCDLWKEKELLALAVNVTINELLSRIKRVVRRYAIY